MSFVSETPDEIALDKPYLRFAFALSKLKTRKYASSILGKSEDMLTAYAKGRTEPPFSVVIALCRATQTDLNWLAYGDGYLRDAGSLDEERLGIAIETVEEVLRLGDACEGLSLQEKSALILRVYEHEDLSNPASIIKLILEHIPTR